MDIDCGYREIDISADANHHNQTFTCFVIVVDADRKLVFSIV